MTNTQKVKLISALSFLLISSANIKTTNDDPCLSDISIIQSDGVNYPFFPSITKLQNGDLVMVYYWNSDHVNTTGGRIYLKKSSNNGISWTNAKLIVDYTAQSLDSRDPHINVLSNGDLVLNCYTGKWDAGFVPSDYQQHIIESRFAKSTDGGLSWSTPKIIPTAKYENATSGAIIELGNGDLLMPTYGRLNAGDNTSVATVIRSSDRGESWNNEVVVTSDNNNGLGYNEMAIGYMGNNTIYAITRPSGKIFKSTDNGYSWQLIDGKPVSMHAPDFLKIDSNRLFLTWCTPDPATGNRIVYGKMFFPYEGWDYSSAKIIYTSTCINNPDMGYPSSVLLSDNRLLTIYYDHHCKNAILGSYSNFSGWDSINTIQDEHDFYVYPNPAKDNVFIKDADSSPLDVRLFSMDGKLLINLKNTAPEVKLDLSGFNNGLYSLAIKSKNKARKYKIIKM